MNDYLLLMLDDAADRAAADDAARWDAYLGTLRHSGRFDGGSSIGDGERVRKGHAPQAVDPALTGFIRVRAESLADAKRLLAGNPSYEAGATVEVRELPRD